MSKKSGLENEENNSWRIKVPKESEDCDERYRKWNPPKEGWYCRETDKKCDKITCPNKYQ